MTWIKLEDSAVDHPKISGLSDRAFRAWIRSLSYASRFLTDGRLPAPFLATVARKVQDEIMDAGLWLVATTGAVMIHDYLEHQTSKADVEKERRRNRDRRAGRTNGTDYGTHAGRTYEKPRPDTEIREQRIDPPNPLAGGVRVSTRKPTVAEQKRADGYLRAIGRCPHDPGCSSRDMCVGKLVYAWRYKTQLGMAEAKSA